MFHRFIRLILLTIAACLFISTTHADENAARQQQQLKEQKTEESLREQQHAPHIQLEEEKPSISPYSAFPQETQCLVVDHLSIQLDPAFTPQDKALLSTFSFLNAILRRYEHQCIGFKGVQFITHALMESIIDKGYSTTRIYVPSQDLSKHQIVFHLVPGIINKVRIEGNSNNHWENAFPFRQGDILNLRDLEQGVEQAKRIESQSVRIEIIPGSNMGESDVLLHLKEVEKPWHINIGMDNNGLTDKDKYQFNSQFTYDNLTHHFDTLALYATSNTDMFNHQHNAQNIALSYNIPYGYWTGGLYTYAATTKQQLKGYTANIQSKSISQHAEFYLQYLFHRNQTQKNSVRLTLGKHWSDSSINHISLSNQHKNTSLASLTYLHTHYLGDIQWNLNIAHQIGYGKAIVSNMPIDQRTIYHMDTIDSSLRIPIHLNHHHLIYLTTLHGQYSNKPLYASDHISLGGRYSVRGFTSQQKLSAEKGFYLRNSLYIPIKNTYQTFYTGIDIGKLYGSSAKDFSSKQLIGSAIGMQGYIGQAVYDFSVGVPIQQPQGFSSKNPVLALTGSYEF